MAASAEGATVIGRGALHARDRLILKKSFGQAQRLQTRLALEFRL